MFPFGVKERICIVKCCLVWYIKRCVCVYVLIRFYMIGCKLHEKKDGRWKHELLQCAGMVKKEK